jgi:tRNA threonylcarbamoyl adenosine modification protein YeaZ
VPTLALDTSTAEGSVALRRDGAIVIARAGDPSHPHGVRLPGDLFAALEQARLTLADVTLLAVGLGPGPFTGLRVGLATIEGVAFATGLPVAGVSGFDALAMAAERSAPRDRIAVVVDGARGEVFAARYIRDPASLGGVRADGEPCAAPLDVVLSEWAREGPLPASWIGNAVVAHRDAIERAAPGALVQPSPLLAPLIAELADRMAADGHLSALGALRPVYVRRPDAELARQRAQATRVG